MSRLKTEVKAGDIFGDRVVLNELESIKKLAGKVRIIEVQCKCGSIDAVRLDHLRAGKSQRCSSCRSRNNVTVGEMFGVREVIEILEPDTKRNETRVKVRCKCGKESDLALTVVKARPSCYECAMFGTDDLYKDLRPFTSHPLYKCWQGIKQRIYNESNDHYEDYGGRGLTMEDAWVDDFGAFATWVMKNLGPKPHPKWSLDRIENDYGYHPIQPDGSYQLRWADKRTQAGNKRDYKCGKWGRWQIGKFVGSLGYVCKQIGTSQERIKYTVETKQISTQEAIEIVLERMGLNYEVKALPA